MILKNPHTEDIEITFKGVTYEIAAGKSRDFPDEVAEYWQKIHQFIVVENDAPKDEAVEIMGEEKVTQIEKEAVVVDSPEEVKPSKKK